MSYVSITITEDGEEVLSGFKGGQDKVHTVNLAGTFGSGNVILQASEVAADYSVAIASIVADTVSALPAEDDVLIVGSSTLHWVTSLVEAGDLLIPTDTAAEVSDAFDVVVSALSGDTAGAGTTYHEETPPNTEVTASVDGVTLDFTAVESGPDGNNLALSTDTADWTVSAFDHGDEELASQWQVVLDVNGNSISLTSGGMREFECEADRFRLITAGSTSPDIKAVVR